MNFLKNQKKNKKSANFLKNRLFLSSLNKQN